MSEQVEIEKCSADSVEFVFQDQYLGRNDMWRLCEHLVGQCVHTNQEIQFIGTIAAKIESIYVGGKKACGFKMFIKSWRFNRESGLSWSDDIFN